MHRERRGKLGCQQTITLTAMLNVSLCRSCGAVVRKARRWSFTRDPEVLQR